MRNSESNYRRRRRQDRHCVERRHELTLGRREKEEDDEVTSYSDSTLLGMSILSTTSPRLSGSLPNSFLTGTNSEVYHRNLNICKYRALLPQPCSRLHSPSLLQREVVSVEREGNDEKEVFKQKWHDVGSNLTDTREHAISQLPSTMTNRSKAVMRRIICFSLEENLFHLLASWVKAMQPKRCEWLSVLKELKRMEISLFFEAMEFALTEESFEANVRDYTKLIDTYAKHSRLQDAQTTFQSMNTRGFPCDQVTLTVLVNMYSRAGDLCSAKEAFEDLKLLRSPPDKRAYSSMVMAYIRAGNLDLAESLLKEMEANEAFAGREVYKAMLRALSMAGDAGGAQRVFDAIQFAGIVPDSKLCALLVNSYCVAGKSDGARSTVENMRAAGVKPNDKCVALMLGAYRRENNLEQALSFLMELVRDGVVIEVEAAEVLAQWLRQLGVVGDWRLVLSFWR